MKQAYISPKNGELSIAIRRDARPEISITLDTGIPNFSLFSIRFPFAEHVPEDMPELVWGAFKVLLDDFSAFLLSQAFQEEVCVDIYSRVLATFKAMNLHNSDVDSDQENSMIKCYEGQFEIPQIFIDETQRKIVTGSKKITINPHEEAKGRQDDFMKELYGATVQNPFNNRERVWNDAVCFEARPWQEGISLQHIRSLAQGEGLGNSGLDWFLSLADKHKLPVTLEPVPSKGGKLNKRQLVSWYKKHDFADIGHGELKREPKIAATQMIKRQPPVRQLELTYMKPNRTTPSDAAQVIRKFRSKIIRNQPSPLYVLVYNMRGVPVGVTQLKPNVPGNTLLHK